mmetsp:Transcript_53011/g.106399  ORF Transcript_53011/g.106399 Transcript_53011/m.106399 type:complete len:136 (+) Transcript_53011:100-507(+)
MGLGCGKAYLPKEDDVVLDGREGASEGRKATAKDEVTAEASPAEGGGQPSSSAQEERKKKKKQKPEETDMVAELLKRAQAGGTEERVAAALAADAPPDAEISDGEDSDGIFLKLLGGGRPPPQAPRAGASGSSVW